MKTSSEENLARAKRKFALNLGLFIGLVVVCFSFLGGNPFRSTDGLNPGGARSADGTEQRSFNEVAYLLGEIAALGEHPEATAPFEEEWVLKMSRTTVEEHTALENAPTEMLAELTEAFFQGYAARFNSYLDTSRAWEVGYAYGRKHDGARKKTGSRPVELVFLNKTELAKLLPEELLRSHPPERFDEAECLLFVLTYHRGFRLGFWESGSMRPGW